MIKRVKGDLDVGQYTLEMDSGVVTDLATVANPYAGLDAGEFWFEVAAVDGSVGAAEGNQASTVEDALLGAGALFVLVLCILAAWRYNAHCANQKPIDVAAVQDDILRQLGIGDIRCVLVCLLCALSILSLYIPLPPSQPHPLLHPSSPCLFMISSTDPHCIIDNRRFHILLRNNHVHRHHFIISL